jgi:hypothetical protein
VSGRTRRESTAGEEDGGEGEMDGRDEFEISEGTSEASQHLARSTPHLDLVARELPLLQVRRRVVPSRALVVERDVPRPTLSRLPGAPEERMRRPARNLHRRAGVNATRRRVERLSVPDERT